MQPLEIASAEGDRELGDLGDARFESWHLVRDGRRYSGGRALAPLLEELPLGRRFGRAARLLEFATVPLYRWVATHRSGLSRLVPERSKTRADEFLESRLRGPGEDVAST